VDLVAEQLNAVPVTVAVSSVMYTDASMHEVIRGSYKYNVHYCFYAWGYPWQFQI